MDIGKNGVLQGSIFFNDANQSDETAFDEFMIPAF